MLNHLAKRAAMNQRLLLSQRTVMQHPSYRYFSRDPSDKHDESKPTGFEKFLKKTRKGAPKVSKDEVPKGRLD